MKGAEVNDYQGWEPAMDDAEFMRYLQEGLGLSKQQIKRGFDRASLADYFKELRGKATASDRQKAQLNRLRDLVDSLMSSGLLYAEEVGRFLWTRHSELQYQRPLVAMRKGRAAEVQTLADQLVQRLSGRGPLEEEIIYEKRDLPPGMQYIHPDDGG